MEHHASPFASRKRPDPDVRQQWAALAQFFHRTLEQGLPVRNKTLYYYTLGAETWKRTDTFPLPNARMQTWYFAAGGSLAVDPSAGTGVDTYEVDPGATTGTNNRWHTQLVKPVIYPDRSMADHRLLTYTSPPLERDIEVTGFPLVTLHVASSTRDAAFFVYLEVVEESGAVRYVTEGMLRGLHRKLSSATPPYVMGQPYHSFRRADAAPLPPKDMVEIVIGMLPTSVLIRAGQRVRIAVAGADNDTFAPIPEAGSPVFSIHRGQARPSSVRLPIVS
jgi:putative CocE/NonD family hydrolase